MNEPMSATRITAIQEVTGTPELTRLFMRAMRDPADQRKWQDLDEQRDRAGKGRGI